MSAIDVLKDRYEYSFGTWPYADVRKYGSVLASISQLCAGISEQEAGDLIEWLYQERDGRGIRAKPTGRDMEQALYQMRRNRGQIVQEGGCAACAGTGQVGVTAHRVDGRWRLGLDPEGRGFPVCTPCTCDRGRRLWVKGVPSNNYLNAQTWLAENGGRMYGEDAEGGGR